MSSIHVPAASRDVYKGLYYVHLSPNLREQNPPNAARSDFLAQRLEGKLSIEPKHHVCAPGETPCNVAKCLGEAKGFPHSTGTLCHVNERRAVTTFVAQKTFRFSSVTSPFHSGGFYRHLKSLFNHFLYTYSQ